MAKTIADALKLATTNPTFAQELVLSPTKFQAEYGLTASQVTQLTNLGKMAKESVATLGLRPVGGLANEFHYEG